MKHPLEQLTAKEMLEIWGLRVSSGSMKDPLAKSTGGKAGPDDELALVLYVETVPGFFEAQPVLLHKYAHFKPLATYRYRRPGETLFGAASRHGQAQLARAGMDELALTKALHRKFAANLVAKLTEKPFMVPRAVIELTPSQIAAQVSSEVDAKAS